jgi:hypothetical protein
MNWINQKVPVKSETKGRQFWRFSTLKEAYDVYKNDMMLAGLPQRSFAFFCNFGYRLRVKKLRFNRYICPKCAEGRHGQPSLLFEEHKELVESQTSWYHKLLAELKPNQILIVQDFTNVHESTTIKAKILNVTIQRAVPAEDGFKIERKYYDFIDLETTSAAVVEYCWDILLRKLALSSFDQGIFI